MKTLDSPVYEVDQNSEWFKANIQEKERLKQIFKEFEEKYGTSHGFGIYHEEYFGVKHGTPAFEIFKDDLKKNADNEHGFHSFKIRTQSYKDIKEMVKGFEKTSSFKSHDVFGFNNATRSHWVKDRWFYQVNDPELVTSDEVKSINYKDYLDLVMETIEE